MARLSQVDIDEFTGGLGRHYEYLKKATGRINTYMKVAAHLPHVTKFSMLMPMVLQREGAGGVLSTRIKEMAVLKTSFLNDCKHCLAHNTALGQAAGITDEQVEAIRSDGYMNADCLTQRQKAAVLWAEHVTLNTARFRNDIFEQMKSLFSEPEILELTLISAQFNMTNRIMDSLHMDITEHDVEKIKGSVQANPANVRRYLETILENWPEEFPEPSDD
jgi:uncharacterized peroxidase-related enzyme